MQHLSSSVQNAFSEQGFLVLPDWLGEPAHAVLCAVCDRLLLEPPDDDNGGQSHDIGRGHDRRFLRHRHTDNPDLAALILGPEFKTLAQALLGASPYLFNEQFVVKGPHTGASFAWHQDSGYLDQPHAPYLSVWIALDDTTADNGALSIIPRDLRVDRSVIPHTWDADGKERVGYDGDDPGVLLEASAGTVVVFSSLTLHRSSSNVTDRPRRAYLVQYSSEVICKVGTDQPKVFATPLG